MLLRDSYEKEVDPLFDNLSLTFIANFRAESHGT